MKPSVPRVFEKERMFDHVNRLTNDVIDALTGGMSVKDNLPMEFVKAVITSGEKKTLTPTLLKKVIGCQIVNTEDADVSLFAVQITQGRNVSITLTIEPETAEITFLLFGE